MQSQNRLFDDFVKMMNGAAGTLAGVGREAQEGMRERMREFMGGMDFVSRDEFEAVKAMAAAARDEVEALKAEVAALRSQAAMGKAPGAAKTAAAFAADAPRKSRGAKPSAGLETPEE
ncbi:accessory factor UbiK family protein [Sphingomonas ginkgonis]|uniref:Accessory factor UbiK family protein n=1 Tax=Sphingomonas ginkgonis TaxID=2315330 RepID=A0A3R9Y5M7_9SPHN|nr:accessory factor UbiK family protein [Sphingomonas ginkgonis]RST30608.1 accessory factor UbiK family protein [Sphingomonas ginkgonis]